MSTDEPLKDDARAERIGTLVDLLDYRAARQRDDVVFRFLSGDGNEEGRLTFGELRSRAIGIASGLREHADAGDRVVLLVPPGLDYVASFFGCLYAGAVAVPAYPPNPRRADPRVHRIIADSRARLALVHSSLASRLESWLALGDAPPQVRWLDVAELAGTGDDRALGVPRASSDLAMLQYTSGSTGEPRGVMLTHENLLHNSSVIHRVSAHRRGDSGVFWLPPFHDMGLIGGIVQPVYVGLPTALMAPATFLQRPLRWLEAMSRYRATTSGAPNFAYDLCVDRTTERERAALDLSAWRTSFNGAEPVRADTMARFVEAFASSGVRRDVIVPCYGLAEATLIVSGGPAERAAQALRVGRRALEQGTLSAAEPGEDTAVLVASGTPADEHEMAIVDPEALTSMGDGQIGEIWVSSPSVARGYWGRPHETTATFGGRLVHSEKSWLRTGDLGARHEGALVVTGRLKDLVILQGRNYYPHDIEVAAERSHADLRPGFSAAFSVGGHRTEELVLALEVTRHHRPSDDAALFHAVRTELAATVGVVPHEILLLRQNTIPRTSSGKIQRGACRAAYLDGTLEVTGRWRVDRADASPDDRATSIHDFLIAWVRDELEIDPSMLHADTPLLELGIDSLAATRLVVALEARLGRRVEVAELWSQPSVGALARHLAAMHAGESSGTVAASSSPVDRPAATPDRITNVGHWPEYRALRARLDLLDGQSIASPFFQVHEGVTGSHAMIAGRRVLNFANYNYLGLSGDPDVTRAAQDAVARWGSSVSASRVVSGERPIHAALEREIASFVGVEDAIVYIGGHPANVSTISHLFGPEDVVLCDALMHNSAVQGAQFSGARRLTFPHNDWRTLDAMLERVRERHRRALVVIEGVYSADGDIPDLQRFVDVKTRHGAMLMVDEAHSLGVLGATGRGIAEHAGVDPRAVDIWMGTLSKSLASCGGYIAGGSALVEYLKYTAPGFVYSVGIPPSNAAAALAALQKLIAEPERVATLRQRAAYFLRCCREAGLDTGASAGTPVIPVIVGDSLRAAKLSAMLLAAGVNVQPMVAPAVPNNFARLRFFVACTHTEDELDTTVRSLVESLKELGASKHGDGAHRHTESHERPTTTLA
ncbi:MAG TPA: aminotransferase class I/II-fold pyridoxal phosphate-dependent enzyme [Gemmatimonadaceae bacterium]|nr:aminotransferase class I/II-fold pyridoxal phosphate-dependent enzyme [Gemmatimonadaceae bacterium]